MDENMALFMDKLKELVPLQRKGAGADIGYDQ